MLTVPGAATRVGRDFKTMGRKAWASVRRQKPVTIHVASAVGLSGEGGLTTSLERRLPSHLSGDVTAQIEKLTEFANGLSETIGALERDVTQQLGELRRAQAAARAAHSDFEAKMAAEQRRADQATLMINARGLPLIGLSILLSGLPDTWIGEHWVGGVLLTASAVLVAVTVVRLRRPEIIDS